MQELLFDLVATDGTICSIYPHTLCLVLEVQLLKLSLSDCSMTAPHADLGTLPPPLPFSPVPRGMQQGTALSFLSQCGVETRHSRQVDGHSARCYEKGIVLTCNEASSNICCLARVYRTFIFIIFTTTISIFSRIFFPRRWSRRPFSGRQAQPTSHPRLALPFPRNATLTKTEQGVSKRPSLYPGHHCRKSVLPSLRP